MDPAGLYALATAAGSGLIDAMTADAWSTIRNHIARIIGHGSAALEQEAIRQLEDSRISIRSSNDPEASLQLRRSLTEEWSRRLYALVEEDSGLAIELENALKLIQQALASPGSVVTQHVTAQRDAYTAGGDQYINIGRRDDDEA